jgi:hypothetical protein
MVYLAQLAFWQAIEDQGQLKWTAHMLSTFPTGQKFWLTAIFLFLNNQHRENQAYVHALSSKWRTKLLYKGT